MLGGGGREGRREGEGGWGVRGFLMLPFTDKSRYHLERQRDASCFHAVLIFYFFFSFCCPPSTPHLGSDSGMNGHQLWGWDKCKKGVGWKEKRGEEIQERVRVGIHGGCEREAIEEYGQWQSGRRREEEDEDGQTRGWSPEDGERCSGEVGALECSLIYLTQAVRWPLLLFRIFRHLAGWAGFKSRAARVIWGVDGGAKSTLHRHWPFI